MLANIQVAELVNLFKQCRVRQGDVPADGHLLILRAK